jgi:hypothetical protein
MLLQGGIKMTDFRYSKQTQIEQMAKGMGQFDIMLNVACGEGLFRLLCLLSSRAFKQPRLA